MLLWTHARWPFNDGSSPQRPFPNRGRWYDDAMTGVIVMLQTLAAMVAGCLLFVLWRRFADHRIAVRLVGAGFCVRAFGGATAFWISWLDAPIARSLHLGEGFWFFGMDGRDYYQLVQMSFADAGVTGFLFPNRIFPSSVWVQVLANGRALFGPSVAAAIFINLFLYLGAAWLVARWGAVSGRQMQSALALAGLSLDPSLVLWSTQPLKETFFVFLAVLFVFSFWRWVGIDAVARERVFAAVVMLGALCVMGGVRWQYAFILWALFVPVSLVADLRRKGQVVRSGLATLLVGVAMGPAMVAARHGSIEDRVRWLFDLPAVFLPLLHEVRLAFDQLEGSTRIGVGSSLEAVPFSDVIARALVLVTPRFVVDLFGLASVGGGRGLWLFAEADTLFVLVYSLFVARVAWRSRPLGMMHNPVLLFLAFLFLSSLPTVYAVNNFGSLIRYRVMLVLPLMLAPLALKRRDESGEGVSEPVGESTKRLS